MAHRDARTLPVAAQEEKRRTAFASVRRGTPSPRSAPPASQDAANFDPGAGADGPAPGHGQAPVRTVVARRTSVSFLSTVTNQGTVRFLVLEGPVTAPILLRFRRRLIRDTNRRVFLAPQARARHSRPFVLPHAATASRARVSLLRTSAR